MLSKEKPCRSVYTGIGLNILFFLCRCILKMDHHCRILCVNIIFLVSEIICCYHEEMVVYLNVIISAWLNNCVGHFNHRYFFSFCLFMTLGCVYCSISGRNLFLDAYNALEVRCSDSHHTAGLQLPAGLLDVLSFVRLCLSLFLHVWWLSLWGLTVTYWHWLVSVFNTRVCVCGLFH